MIQRNSSSLSQIKRSLCEQPSLLLWLEKHPKVNTISFDVFETLLHRGLANEAVTYGTANALEQMLAQAGATLDWQSCLALRRVTHQQAIAQSVKEGKDTEVFIRDWFRAWLEAAADKAGLEPSRYEPLLEPLLEKELELEQLALSPIIPNLALCKTLKAKGYRLIFTSDMYLGKVYVQRLLDAHGYAGLFDAGYVSGDCGYLKHSGGLFQYMLQHESDANPALRADAIVHVGDTPNADDAPARALGLHTWLYQPVLSKTLQRSKAFDFKSYLRDPYAWAGYVAASVTEYEEKPATAYEAYLGQSRFAPPIANFTHHLIEAAENKALDAIYFIARDGFLFKQAFEVMQPLLRPELAVETGYLCLSRLTSFWPTLSSFGLRELHAMVINYDYPTVARCFALLKLPEEKLQALAARYGFADIHQPVNPFTDPAFHQLLNSDAIQAAAKDCRQKGSVGLRNYLQQLGLMRHSRIALVDVGWGGQIQENLTLFLRQEVETPDSPFYGQALPEFYGIYLGANHFSERRRATGLRMAAPLCDMARYEWHAGAAFECLPALETMLRPPHGTVVGYEPETGLPLFADASVASRQKEAADDVVLAQLHQGILTGVRHYGRAAAILGFRASQARRYARFCLSVLLRFPGALHAATYLRMSYSENMGTDQALGMAQQGGWEGSFSLQACKTLLKNGLTTLRKTLWKESALAPLGWPAYFFWIARKAWRGTYLYKGSYLHSPYYVHRSVDRLQKTYPIPEPHYLASSEPQPENKQHNNKANVPGVLTPFEIDTRAHQADLLAHYAGYPHAVMLPTDVSGMARSALLGEGSLLACWLGCQLASLIHRIRYKSRLSAEAMPLRRLLLRAFLLKAYYLADVLRMKRLF